VISDIVTGGRCQVVACQVSGGQHSKR